MPSRDLLSDDDSESSDSDRDYSDIDEDDLEKVSVEEVGETSDEESEETGSEDDEDDDSEHERIKQKAKKKITMDDDTSDSNSDATPADSNSDDDNNDSDDDTDDKDDDDDDDKQPKLTETSSEIDSSDNDSSDASDEEKNEQIDKAAQKTKVNLLDTESDESETDGDKDDSDEDDSDEVQQKSKDARKSKENTDNDENKSNDDDVEDDSDEVEQKKDKKDNDENKSDDVGNKDDSDKVEQKNKDALKSNEKTYYDDYESDDEEDGDEDEGDGSEVIAVAATYYAPVEGEEELEEVTHVDEEVPSVNQQEVASEASSPEDETLGMLDFNETHVEEEVVFGDTSPGPEVARDLRNEKVKRKKKNPFSWLFSRFRTDRDAVQDAGSWGADSKPHHSRSNNDDNQVLSMKKEFGSEKPRNTVHESVIADASLPKPISSNNDDDRVQLHEAPRDTRAALGDMPSLSVKKDFDSAPTVEREKPRNTRTALAGMQSLSVRKYNKQPLYKDIETTRGEPTETSAGRSNKPALSDLEPLSIGGLAWGYDSADKEDEDEEEPHPNFADVESFDDSPAPVATYEYDGSLSTPSHEAESYSTPIYASRDLENPEGPAEKPGRSKMKPPNSARDPPGTRNPKPEKKELGRNRRRRRIVILICIFLVVGVGGGIGIGLFLIDRKDEADGGTANSQTPPTSMPFADEDQKPSPIAPNPDPTLAPAQSTLQPTRQPTRQPTTLEPTQTLRGALISLLSPLSSAGVFDDPTSQQSRALEWLVGNSRLLSYDREKLITRYALAVFYYSTFGDNWTTKTRWMSNADECTWYVDGIRAPCDVGRSFAHLMLSDNNVQGTLPAELALLFESLARVDLGGNALAGPIPTQFGSLTRLISFRIEGNDLVGGIPTELGAWTRLSELDLSRNGLTQALPSNLGLLTSLKSLNLAENQIAGNLPAELGNLAALTSLSLRDNRVEGQSPRAFGGLTRLQVLDLSINRLDERIPSELGLLTDLTSLILRDNALTGQLPLSLNDLNQLTMLRIEVNRLEGTVPVGLCGAFDTTFSTFFADCQEVICPCCNFCCTDGIDECTCPFAASNPILCIP
jgi:Leucine-rich repeat (LRR) protein